MSRRHCATAVRHLRPVSLHLNSALSEALQCFFFFFRFITAVRAGLQLCGTIAEEPAGSGLNLTVVYGLWYWFVSLQNWIPVAAKDYKIKMGQQGSKQSENILIQVKWDLKNKDRDDFITVDLGAIQNHFFLKQTFLYFPRHQNRTVLFAWPKATHYQH